jgi:hypothetical protein
VISTFLDGAGPSIGNSRAVLKCSLVYSANRDLAYFFVSSNTPRETFADYVRGAVLPPIGGECGQT